MQNKRRQRVSKGKVCIVTMADISVLGQPSVNETQCALPKSFHLCKQPPSFQRKQQQTYCLTLLHGMSVNVRVCQPQHDVAVQQTIQCQAL